MSIRHKSFSHRALRNRDQACPAGWHAREMDFATRRCDPRLHAFVVALDRGDAPMAETWRLVGEAAWELGLPRPSYHTIRELVLVERLRRKARTATRAAALQVITGIASSRVVDVPIALDALERARAKERLVSDRHKPP